MNIGDGAFACCTALKNIKIPNSVISIGKSAFACCIALKNVNIPNSVTRIGECAFWGCQTLKFKEYNNGLYLGNKENPYASLIKAKSEYITTCKIKETCKCIEYGAFSGCEELTSIIIPNNITSIGNRVFYGCTKLTSVTIPNSVTSIGDEAFYGCKKLTSVTIPNSVTNIEKYAFFGCIGLTNIIIGNNIKNIEGNTFDVCKIKHKPKDNIAYKGLNVDMTCRDFQYEEGKTYTCNKSKLCGYGFHACLNPLDCFNYYADKDTVYHEVILEDRTKEIGGDSKTCGKKITIGRRLTIQEMVSIFNELNKG